MLLRALLVSTPLLFSLSAAQGADEACLRAFAQTLAPASPLTADFSMSKRVPGVNRPLPAGGRLVTDPGRGLIWETSFPLEEVRVFGKARYGVTDEKGVLQIRDLPTDQIAALLTQTPEELLASLKSRFFVICTQKRDSASLILSPKPGTLAEHITEIALHAHSELLTRVSITQPGNAVTHITFTNATRPASISDKDAALFEKVR